MMKGFFVENKILFTTSMKKDNFGGTFSAGIMARVFVLPQPG
jgi:hypothetical protein